MSQLKKKRKTWKFSVKGPWTKLRQGRESVISRCMIVKNPRVFIPGRVRRIPDTYTYFYDPDGKRFPTGLLGRALASVENAGGKSRIKNGIPTYTPPKIPKDYLFGIDLRKYQLRVINTVLRNISGTSKVATGGGKTAIMAAVHGWLAREQGYRSLILVNGKSSLHQTYREFKKLLGSDVSIGMLGDGFRSLDAQIVIATVNTSMQGLPKKGPFGRITNLGKKDVARFLGKVDVIAVDEAHHAGSKTWMEVCMGCVNARHRYGYSGTPETRIPLRDLRLEAACGPRITTVERKDLIEDGWLVNADILVLTDPDAMGQELPDDWDTWPEVYKYGIVRNKTYNRTVAKVLYSLDKLAVPTLCLAPKTKQIDRICKNLRQLDVPHRRLDGSSSVPVRERAIAALKKGKINIIIASTIFDESQDIPEAVALVLAGGEKGENKLIQRTGRVLRLSRGKMKAIVIDFHQSTHKYLDKHAKRRQSVFRSEGHPIHYARSFRRLVKMIKSSALGKSPT